MGLRIPVYFWIFGIAILLTPLVRCEEELQHSHMHSSHDNDDDDDDDNYTDENDEEDEQEYNHQVVIGSKREAKQFHSLTVDEAKQKLAEIVKQIDVNGDKVVNKLELLQYIKQNLRKLDLESAENGFKQHNSDLSNSLSWAEYVLSQYGYSVQQIEEFASQSDDDTLHFLEMVGEDRARWAAADVNKDSELDLEEFVAFLAPFNYEHMQNYEVDRVLSELDDSADGSVDLKEFEAHETGSYNDDAKERFVELDKNTDGKLERSEIRDWVAPGLEISAELEARQLLRSTKPDAEELTLSEILDHHELWVGSQAHAKSDSQTKDDSKDKSDSEVKSDSETKSAEANSNLEAKSTETSDSDGDERSSHTEL